MGPIHQLERDFPPPWPSRAWGSLVEEACESRSANEISDLLVNDSIVDIISKENIIF